MWRNTHHERRTLRPKMRVTQQFTSADPARSKGGTVQHQLGPAPLCCRGRLRLGNNTSAILCSQTGGGSHLPINPEGLQTLLLFRAAHSRRVAHSFGMSRNLNCNHSHGYASDRVDAHLRPTRAWTTKPMRHRPCAFVGPAPGFAGDVAVPADGATVETYGFVARGRWPFRSSDAVPARYKRQGYRGTH
jgi:hypothetical protein